MIDLAASGLCRLDVYSPDVTLTAHTYPAPATIIVGEHWLTLQVGDHKIVRPPVGVTPRLATES